MSRLSLRMCPPMPLAQVLAYSRQLVVYQEVQPAAAVGGGRCVTVDGGMLNVVAIGQQLDMLNTRTLERGAPMLQARVTQILNPKREAYTFALDDRKTLSLKW